MGQGGGGVRRRHRFEKPPGPEGEEETGAVNDGGEGRLHVGTKNRKRRRGASFWWNCRIRLETESMPRLRKPITGCRRREIRKTHHCEGEKAASGCGGPRGGGVGGVVWIDSVATLAGECSVVADISHARRLP